MLLSFHTAGLTEAGCDEAGRGCLAGPVFAAAVILPPDYKSDELNDSKKLNEKQRYKLRKLVEEKAVSWAVAQVSPEEIDENVIESHLLFKLEPDLVIRAGGKRLTDFLIWQSVYSELYFTDVNWLDFRKVDFLRILRDFQKRQRRFGK